MTTVVERITILPAIEDIRDTATISIMQLDTVRNTVTGVDLSSDDPVATAAIAAYQLESAALATKLTADLAAKTTAYDAEVAKVAALEAEKTKLKTAIDALTALNIEANATIATLQQRIASLEAIRAFNPRWTTPDYFINRFTAHEAKAFYSSDDPMIEGGRELLEAYESAGYHVDLDDTQVQGLTGYMVQLGMLASMERRAEVLRDATAQEAWYQQ